MIGNQSQFFDVVYKILSLTKLFYNNLRFFRTDHNLAENFQVNE